MRRHAACVIEHDDDALELRTLIPKTPSPTDTSYIPTLDGWRAIAVLGVIAWHLRADVHAHAPGGALSTFVGLGRLGVDLFFAISGFLITSRLANELDATGTLRLRSFYARRAFRILPPALLFLALIGVMAHLRMWRPLQREWYASLFFYRNYSEGHRVTDHLWSLSIEEHFYATWPLLLLLCARGRRALVAIPAIAIAVAVWRVLVVRGYVTIPIPGNLWFRTDIRFDALLWGAALALVRRTDVGRARVAKWISRPVWLLAAAAFVACAFIAQVDVLATILALSAPIVVVGTAVHPQWLVSRLLEARPLRWIGRLSYSLYLFQQPFVEAGLPIRHGFLYVLPVACASYYLVEQPMIRLGRDLLAGGSRAPSPRRRVIGASFAVAVLVIIGSVIWFRARQLVGRQVVVYSNDEFCGDAQTLGVGRHDLTAPGMIGNDVISSIRVGTRVRVRLCDDVDAGEPGGDCIELPPGAMVLRIEGFGDRASFVEVIATD